MFTLFVFGVVLALIGVVAVAIAILVALVGSALGAISTALFIVFCVYLVWRIAQAILDEWNKKH